MSSEDLALMAHLMRRAGFGATRDELEAHVANGYEETVEDLLHARDRGNIPDDVIRRYHVAADEGVYGGTRDWMYRMITTPLPARGEADPLLARPLRHLLLQGQPGQDADQPAQHLPPALPGQLP